MRRQIQHVPGGLAGFAWSRQTFFRKRPSEKAVRIVSPSALQRIMLKTPSHRAEEPGRPPQEVRAWVAMDMVPSDQPTADAALEEVLRALDMRCA